MIAKQSHHRVDLGDSILDAADRLLQRYGYSKTAVDDVAREAGIGKGTIYLYFKSKEDLALASADRMSGRMRVRLRDVADAKGSPAARVRQFLIERVLLRFDTAQDYGRSLDDLYASLRPQLLARRRAYHDAEAEVLAEVLLDGRHRGDFDVPEALPVARTAILATNALMPYSLTAEQLGKRDDVEAAAGRIADMLLGGILSRDRGAPGGGNRHGSGGDSLSDT